MGLKKLPKIFSMKR